MTVRELRRALREVGEEAGVVARSGGRVKRVIFVPPEYVTSPWAEFRKAGFVILAGKEEKEGKKKK